MHLFNSVQFTGVVGRTPGEKFFNTLEADEVGLVNLDTTLFTWFLRGPPTHDAPSISTTRATTQNVLSLRAKAPSLYYMRSAHHMHVYATQCTRSLLPTCRLSTCSLSTRCLRVTHPFLAQTTCSLSMHNLHLRVTCTQSAHDEPSLFAHLPTPYARSLYVPLTHTVHARSQHALTAISTKGIFD